MRVCIFVLLNVLLAVYVFMENSWKFQLVIFPSTFDYRWLLSKGGVLQYLWVNDFFSVIKIFFFNKRVHHEQVKSYLNILTFGTGLIDFI